jgi:hypothetical protein
MTRDDLLQRLKRIQEQGSGALRALEAAPRTSATEAEARTAAAWIKSELHQEFLRISPERTQKGMTLFEVSVYAPTVEEAWKDSGISRLRLDGPITSRWLEVMESILYTVCKYVSQGVASSGVVGFLSERSARLGPSQWTTTK